MAELCVRLVLSSDKQGNANERGTTTTTTMSTGSCATITKRVPRHQRSRSDTILSVENLHHLKEDMDTFLDTSPLASTVDDTTAASNYCSALSSLIQRKRTRSLSMPLEESRDLFFQPPLVVKEPEVGDNECPSRRGSILGERLFGCSSPPLEDTTDDDFTAATTTLEQVGVSQQLEQPPQHIPSNVEPASPGSSFPISISESSDNGPEAEEEESASLPLFSWQQYSDESSESSSYSSSLVSFRNSFSGDGINIRNSVSSTTTNTTRDHGGTTVAAVDRGNTNGNVHDDDDGADLALLMDEIRLLIMEAAAQPKKSQTRHRPKHAAPTIKTLSDLVDHEKWERVIKLVQDYPDLCKSTVTVCFQGEKIPCLILHCIMMKKSVPVDVVDAVVTVHPAALTQGDGKCGRLPLHFAILRGASLAVLRYLCRAMPSTLAMPDADAEGNVALHYAVQYAYDDATIRLILEFSSSSSSSSSKTNICALANKRERLVLHILCSRCCWEGGEDSQGSSTLQPTSEDAPTSPTTNSNQQFVISIETVRAIVQEYPEACSVPDRNGRLALHLYCEQRHPRWDVLQVLVQAYPAGLLVKENTRKMIPMQLLKQWQSKSCKSIKQQQQQHQDDDNDVVKLYLQECTAKERRKRQPMSLDNLLFMMKQLPLHVKGRRQQQQKTSPATIVDLMNCYG